jgi:signal transduction histidine kinase
MENNHLKMLNEASLMLLHASTTKQLEVAVVESAKKIGGSQTGHLYIYTKERLKRIYSSNATVQKSPLIKYPPFKNYLKNDQITFISDSILREWKLEGISSSTKSIIVVPLFHTVTLGYILLFRNTAEELKQTDKDALQLFSQTAVLALTKAILQDDSKRALEIRDRFISLASHELRTPLTSLHGYIQLLHAKMTGQKSVEARWVNELYIESIRLTTLVKELLDVNRIKQGQFAFVFSEVPMQDVVERAIDHHRVTSADHPVVFQNKIRDGGGNVVGDFDKLVEMVSGLLGNAIKFSKPLEKITVSLKSSQGTLTLVVKDSGKGISKKDLAAVFDGFYKSAHASYLEGMGVGLLLAKHIIDNHRGKIKITSKENKGTKVEVMLPTIKTSTF